MAPESNPSDDTSWTGLPGSAKDGQLKLAPTSALRCAQHVEDMLNVVVGVQEWMTKNVQLASPIIAESVSGRLLWTVFNLKFGTELKQRIDRHHTILVDMGNTFVAAGKRYERTEHDSKVSFDDLSFDDPSGTPPSGVPAPVPIPDRPNKPVSGTQYDAYGFGPELGKQLGWEALWMIGNSIDAKAVAAAAGVWYWLSQTLDTGFTTLRSTISAVSYEWQGAGAEAAITATTQYVGASQRLTGDMKLLGDALQYTSGWLQQTKQNSMPPTPQPPPPTSISQQMANEVNLIRWQENFQLYYSDNYVQTTTSIVKLPDPDPVTTVPDPEDDESPNDDHDQPPTTDDEQAPPPEDETSGDNGGDSGGQPPPESGGGDPPPSGEQPPTGEHPPSDGNPPPVEHPPTGPETPPGTPNPLEGIENNPLSTLAQLPKGPLANEFSGNLPLAVNNPMLPKGGPLAALGKGGIGGPGRGLFTRDPLALQESKLFPRATVPGEAKIVGRAGPALGREPGMPFGGAPGRPTGEEREKKRNEYLNSTEHLDEAIGAPERGIRPVLDR